MYKKFTQIRCCPPGDIFKLLLVMKLIALLVIASLVQVSASTFGQQMTLKDNNATYEQVFREIRRQTGYDVLMENTRFDTKRRVRMHFEEAPLKEVLSYLVQGTGLTYVINETAIVFKEKPVLEKVQEFFSEKEELRQLSVRGKVTDTLGAPLPGVTVRVLGTNNGAFTDQRGGYVLEGVGEDAVLHFSMVGFEELDVPVNGRAVVDVMLKVSLSPLDEVQVIAYGTTTKRFQTGNVTTVRAEDIGKQPVNNPILALSGRVPGLFVEQTSGFSGSGVIVRIQGQNSIANGNDPFYVIDGVPYIQQLLPGLSGIQGTSGGGAGNPLSFINPQDIESIEVLKDADATAIYGSRAANGAILITTKKGMQGQTRVSLNFQSGFGQVANKLKMLNTEQYLEMRKEAYQNDGLPIPDNTTTPGFSNYDLTTWNQVHYTDWQEVLLGGEASYTDVQTTISGGGNKTQILLGMNYHGETTVFPGDSRDKRGVVHFSANHSSDDQKLKLKVAGNYMADVNNLFSLDLTGTAVTMIPNSPELYHSDGSLNWEQLPDGTSTRSNPLASILRKFNNKTDNLVANLDVSYELFSKFLLKGSFGFTHLASDQFTSTPLLSLSPQSRPLTTPRASYLNSDASSWIIEPQLTYQLETKFGNMDFLIGSTFQRNRNDLMAFDGSGYSNDGQLENIRAAASITVQNTMQSEYNYNAFFGRINYNLKDRYVVNLSIRRDGSSRFGSANLFQNFYAIGAAWIFTNEKVLSNKLTFLDFGKLRFSYGSSGNDQIADYGFMSLYDPVWMDRPYGGGTGLYPTGHNNPYLQWEETRKINVGIDLVFWEDRITLSSNFYRNRSSNQLLDYTLPSITGFNRVTQNFNAKVQNSGFEGSLSTVNIKSRDFQWATALNLTINRNKLIEFPKLEASSYRNRLVVGEPLNISRVYRFARVNPESGVYEFYAANGTLTFNPSALTDQITLNLTPKYYGGFQNTISYKGFSLDVLFQFVKQKASDAMSIFGTTWPGSFFSVTNRNQPISVLNRWKKNGDIANIQRVSTTASYLSQHNFAIQSDAAYIDASYIRLKNLSLSWGLPADWLNRIRFQNARIYIQGQNLLTFTKFSGLDPETKSSTVLPPLLVMTIGVKVTL